MTMRRMLVAAILLAGGACSDGDDSPAEADEAVTEADPAPAPAEYIVSPIYDCV